MFYIEMAFLALHLAKYREHFIEMAINFSVTYVLKRVMKSIDDVNKADLISLSGYTLTFTSFVKYLVAVKNTPKIDDTGAVKIYELIPELIESLKNMKKQ